MIRGIEEYPEHGKIENYNISVAEVASFIRNCVSSFGDNPYAYDWLALGENDEEEYGVVIGWSYGFDEEDEDCIDGYCLCMKLAILESSMGMEFDDFNMPYTVNGDVWDTCTQISRDPNSDFELDAKWIIESWNQFCNEYADSREFIHGIDDSENDDFDDEDGEW